MASHCPICDISLPEAPAVHGALGQPFAARRNCPRCSTALVAFPAQPRLPQDLVGGWRVDQGEMARRRHATRYDRAA